MTFSLENKSDECSYQRNTNFVAQSTDRIVLDGEKSTIKSQTGVTQDLTETFSGYFPRLVQGENVLSIKILDGSANIVIRTPVARWIT